MVDYNNTNNNFEETINPSDYTATSNDCVNSTNVKQKLSIISFNNLNTHNESNEIDNIIKEEIENLITKSNNDQNSYDSEYKTKYNKNNLSMSDCSFKSNNSKNNINELLFSNTIYDNCNELNNNHIKNNIKDIDNFESISPKKNNIYKISINNKNLSSIKNFQIYNASEKFSKSQEYNISSLNTPELSSKLSPDLNKTINKSNSDNYLKPEESSLLLSSRSMKISSNLLNNDNKSSNNSINKFNNSVNYSPEEDTAKNFEISINDYNIEITECILNKYKGKFTSIICTQIGSRAFQKAIIKTNIDIIDYIVEEELLQDFNKLFTDKYANYTCQKIYNKISHNVKLKLINNLDIKYISFNETGTYPLQSIIENMNTNEEKHILLERYTPFFKDLSLNKNGNHIIEKSLNNLTYEYMFIFYDIIIDNYVSFANNQYGIKIIKLYAKQVGYNQSSLEMKKNFELFEIELFKNIEDLINHEFGNYLIQTVIIEWKILYSWKIVDFYENRLLELSMNKYSSNVLEKLIFKLEDKLVDIFINEIICNVNSLTEYIKSHYFLFVLQKSIVFVKDKVKLDKIFITINKSLSKIKDKKVLNRWSVFLLKFNNNSFNSSIKIQNSNSSNIDYKSSSFVPINILNNNNIKNLNNLTINKSPNLKQNNCYYNSNFKCSSSSSSNNINTNSFLSPEIHPSRLLSPVYNSNFVYQKNEDKNKGNVFFNYIGNNKLNPNYNYFNNPINYNLNNKIVLTNSSNSNDDLYKINKNIGNLACNNNINNNIQGNVNSFSVNNSFNANKCIQPGILNPLNKFRPNNNAVINNNTNNINNNFNSNNPLYSVNINKSNNKINHQPTFMNNCNLNK